jgi:hypothetical protein
VIHLEGMGINGALIARLLRERDIDFTWSDIDSPVSAWQASTGIIYPGGSTKFGPDAACYDVWRRWQRDPLLSDFLELATYFFNHKNAPHEGPYKPSLPSEHGLRCSDQFPSIHLNAQRLVRFTREGLADRRVATAPEGSRVIRTHGFTERCTHVYWGWTVLVSLGYDRAVYDLQGRRPSIYLRDWTRMAYAYPVPGTPYWYAGSSLIKQKISGARELEVAPKFQTWRSLFNRLSGGAFEVLEQHSTLTGYRPCAAAEDLDWVRVASDGTITLRPLWNSGVRHHPYQWLSVCLALGIDPQMPEFAL